MNSIDEHTNVVGVVWGFIQLAFRGLANTFNCCFILFTNIAREGIAGPNMRGWGVEGNEPSPPKSSSKALPYQSEDLLHIDPKMAATLQLLYWSHHTLPGYVNIIHF